MCRYHGLALYLWDLIIGSKQALINLDLEKAVCIGDSMWLRGHHHVNDKEDYFKDKPAVKG